MPRKPRIELAGFHHVINRGVNGNSIFKEASDYDTFLKIVCKSCRQYQVVLHDYCLMNNHFHLLIETKLRNISLFMKHINSNYAIYANKKYNRTGHFWQGRFYSRYVASENYYYTLIRYIEQNPIIAKVAKKVGEYPYTLASVIINKNTPAPCTIESKLLKELKYENIQEIIGAKLREDELDFLEELKKQKSVTVNKTNKLAFSKTLKEHFQNQDRDKAIISALKDGYTQAQIAKYLNVSRSLVCKIVKKMQEE